MSAALGREVAEVAQDLEADFLLFVDFRPVEAGAEFRIEVLPVRLEFQQKRHMVDAGGKEAEFSYGVPVHSAICREVCARCGRARRPTVRARLESAMVFIDIGFT